MARTLNRLSARAAATLAAIGRHSDGGGLYLHISSNGGRRWLFMFHWAGSRREMGLGSARDVSLAQARERATAARAILAGGKNPLEARVAQQSVPTVGQVADDLIDSMATSWRNEKHRRQWEVSLGRRDAREGAGDFAKALRSKVVDGISTEDVLAVLKPIWATKPETASRLRGRIEAVLDAARAQGHRQGENPARWRGHLAMLLPPARKLSRGHHAAMAYADVPAYLASIRTNETISNLALEFLILTASRSGEVFGARWREVDIKGRLWRVPADRMKGGRPHEVPLSKRALTILATLRDRNGDTAENFIFPGAKANSGLSTMAFNMAMRRTGAEDFTPHGFRSSFRDWSGDRTAFPRDVVEAALAHRIENATEAAYRRSTALEKRRLLMEAWAGFLTAPAGGKVIPIAAAHNSR